MGRPAPHLLWPHPFLGSQRAWPRIGVGHPSTHGDQAPQSQGCWRVAQDKGGGDQRAQLTPVSCLLPASPRGEAGVEARAMPPVKRGGQKRLPGTPSPEGGPGWRAW